MKMKAPKTVKANFVSSHVAKKRHSFSLPARELGSGSHVAQNAATHIKSTMKRFK